MGTRYAYISRHTSPFLTTTAAPTMWTFFLAATLLAAASAQQCGVPGGASSHIINGVDAAKGEIPWQLALERGFLGLYSHSCGSVVLSSKWALTACHCVAGGQDDAADIRIVAGQHARSDDESLKQIRNVKRVIQHPRCNLSAPGVPEDYALLELETDLDLSPGKNVVPACLPPSNGNYVGNKDCWVSGWGRISGNPEDNTLGDKLQKGRTNVLSKTDCAQKMRSVQGVVIGDYHVCVQNEAADMGACSGDSGGPLSCKNKQGFYEVVGVASWVIVTENEDCIRTMPNAYARISHAVDWIKKVTGLQTSCH